ncbi:MAG TPA: AmiS/UreI family transporter [Streptosporangiaceae bacterium]|nr:AmiS/UreI family transporter [Streptosporangiaceae bacterium]
MLLGVVLLYVGAVLAVNGIWLIGQARAAAAARSVRPVAAAEAAAGQELGGEQVAIAPVARAERSPAFIQNREIAMLNIFTGFIGVVAASTLLIQGNRVGDLSSVRAGGFILLFAFTYLWVSFNQFLNAGGKAFGWYCLFVAITAIPAGVFTLQAAHGNTATIWLGINWFAWALLWGMFWALLTLDLPIARITGALAILEGVGTSWALAIAILEGKLAF